MKLAKITSSVYPVVKKCPKGNNRLTNQQRNCHKKAMDFLSKGECNKACK